MCLILKFYNLVDKLTKVKENDNSKSIKTFKISVRHFNDFTYRERLVRNCYLLVT